ncbi:STAS domain-containing protein [Streptomyces sp. NPDC014805]|uniref:STAS domain-containing protein n=1 Tax=Streptomyces sp. NPDC014805 TaxID=3364919 RepID=UPI0036FBF50C
MAEDDMTGAGPSVERGKLAVTATASGDVRVLSVAGEIDHQTGRALRNALDPAGAPRPRTVVDLRHVTFMDSSGLNILLHAHRSHTTAGGWLRLAAVQPAVLRTLQLVGVDTVIDIRETVEEALSD